MSQAPLKALRASLPQVYPVLASAPLVLVPKAPRIVDPLQGFGFQPPSTSYVGSGSKLLRPPALENDPTSSSIPFQRNPPPRPSSSAQSLNSSKPDPLPDSEPSPEAEVSDREWEMRVARAMLHLRDTLPRLFEGDSGPELFPADIYSKDVVLKLPHPFPLKIGSLHGYRMSFGIARNGMQALHTDLSSTLHRLTFTPPPPPSPSAPKTGESQSPPLPRHRQKQLRILLSIKGMPRLHGLHPKEAEWHTSSLYTFNPYSGLIGVHEVETIRPLPGEGVAEWVLSRLGLTTPVRGVAADASVGCVER